MDSQMDMDVHDSILDLIGNTPLVRLTRMTRANGPGSATVLAKLESFNPGNSAKDRIALRMIDAAERSGELRPGGTIVEPTSGNTGVGLALVAQQRGYSCVFTCPDKVSPDKIAVLRAYGAKVVVCPSTAPPDHPDFYRNVAERLAGELPDAYRPDQYNNPNNPQSHYHSTGPEIWTQTRGRVSALVAGVGTGGTLSGTGRYLKEVSGGAVKVVGADPDGSVYSAPELRPYVVEGVGQPSLPGSFDAAVPDEILMVSDRDSIDVTRRLATEEGILTGGSGGMAVWAALRTAARLGPDDVVVVIVPDSGRGYLSKIFNDEWLARSGFGAEETTGPRVEDALAACPGGPVVAHPDDSIGAVLKQLADTGRPLALVAAAPLPLRAAEVRGTASESALAGRLATGAADLDDRVGDHLGAALDTVGLRQSLVAAVDLLAGPGALTVLDAGVVAGVITAHDIATLLRDPMTKDR